MEISDSKRKVKRLRDVGIQYYMKGKGERASATAGKAKRKQKSAVLILISKAPALRVDALAGWVGANRAVDYGLFLLRVFIKLIPA